MTPDYDNWIEGTPPDSQPEIDSWSEIVGKCTSDLVCSTCGNNDGNFTLNRYDKDIKVAEETDLGGYCRNCRDHSVLVTMSEFYGTRIPFSN